MPNEMNHAEVAENMLKRINRPYSAHAIALDNSEIELLRRIANGELVEVVHAHWIKHNVHGKECSNCNASLTKENLSDKYCPSCGALMGEPPRREFP